MKLSAQFGDLSDVKADWLIVGLWDQDELPPEIAKLNDKIGGAITQLKEQRDLSANANDVTPLFPVNQINASRLLIVGLGKPDNADVETIRNAAASATRFATKRQHDTIAMALPSPTANLTHESLAVAVGVGLWQGCQGPGLRKTEPSRFAPRECIVVASSDVDENQIRRHIKQADSEGRGVQLARELVNLPPCDLYPETFAERCQELAKQTGMECQILNEADLERENMGAMLGVGRGSTRQPRLVVLRYAGKTGGKTLGWVGKGVTFDSGGLSLKSSEQMLDMKCDMAGAAAVVGALSAVAEQKLPVNIFGVLPLVENMPDGKALKLRDVVKTRNGKTIEIHNTDAEGRLILADALAYAVDHRADHLVDLATLTGACMIALGEFVAGVMGNDEAWTEKVLAASKRAGEKAWPLPMFPLYREMIKSDVADIKNTGGTRYAGAISAAKLLEEFVAELPWVHIDIAGPSWADRESASHDSGGTGCFVRTLVELARDYDPLAG